MGEYLKTYERICQDKEIEIQVVAYNWQHSEIEEHQNMTIRKIRYVSQKYPIPSNTEIYPDGVFIQIYTDPLILIEVQSKEVAQGFLQQFKILWGMAKA